MGELKEKLKALNERQITRTEIINMMLYATILIMPLIVVNISKPRYVLGKIMFLYIIGIFLIINIGIDIIKGNRIKFRKEYVVVAIFLITILLSCIFSPYKFTAFIGSQERSEGFITILIYIILFLSASKYLIITRNSFCLILSIVSIHALYGVLQFYGIDPIQKWSIGSVILNHSFGLIGNRNFFSSYIIIFLILSITSYIFRGGTKNLIFSIILFSALICSLTRSGWLSILVVGILGIFFVIKRKECIKRLLIILFVFVLSIFVLNMTSNGSVFGRVQHTRDEINLISEKHTNIEESKKNIGSSINSRNEITKIYLKAFFDSPFLGTGPDTFKTMMIDRNFDEYFIKVTEIGESIDKAHNEYLEYATSCGIFTLISYLVLLGMIIWGLIRNIKDDKSKIILLTILGYMIQAFFNISVPMVAPLFWILLGYAVKVIYENKELKKVIIQNK